MAISLMEKLLKAGTIKESAIMNESDFFGEKELVPTPIPMLNVALSGRFDGGLPPGILMLAGPSKHFKTIFALIMARSFLNQYEDGILIFYDSEYGSPPAYFENLGIDTSRVIHVPITDVEDFKHDLANRLHSIDKKDHVIVLVDSIGNLASRKEADDALDGKVVADMTRAKQLKSMYRIATPHLGKKDIPMVVVNHTYMEIGMFPKAVVSGGTGGVYASDAIWIIGRRQDQDSQKNLLGWKFVVNIEKSRHVREKTKIDVTVQFKGGIAKYSGMLDFALEHGFADKPKKGWYRLLNPETGEVITDKNYREKELLVNGEPWELVRSTTRFDEAIKEHYTISASNLIADEESGFEDDETDEEDLEEFADG